MWLVSAHAARFSYLERGTLTALICLATLYPRVSPIILNESIARVALSFSQHHGTFNSDCLRVMAGPLQGRRAARAAANSAASGLSGRLA